MGGGGVIHDPSGMEIPRGWGGLIGRTIRGGGMDIFWNYTILTIKGWIVRLNIVLGLIVLKCYCYMY